MDIYINGEITDKTVIYVAEVLRKEYVPGVDINVYIDSFGGYIDSADMIAEMLVECRNFGSRIICRNTGDVASAATIIWLTGNDRIFDFSKGEFLIHMPYVEVAGTSDELIEVAISLTETEQELAELYSVYSGKPIDEIIERMKKEVPMTWREMFEYKLATEIEVDELPDDINEPVE